jgi:3-oxoacyl-[acyl-carrier-protein] synthase II
MKRVVITGTGVVSPLSSDKDQFWQKICAGESGIGKLTRLPHGLYPRDLAAEIRDWQDLPEAADKDLSTFGQAVSYAVAAARMTLLDAGFGPRLPEDNDCSVLVGTTMGSQDVVERVINRYDLDEDSRILSKSQAEGLQHFGPSTISNEVARRCECRGNAMTFVNACAAGNYAVGIGFARIRSGQESMVLAGGSDPFTRACYTIFHRLNASAAAECRPFDRGREGMVVGEGAAMLLLEEYEHAVARNARIYAEVTGYGLACDAYHATAPHPEGRGAVTAMRRALEQSGLTPDDIDYISAHGTGTVANDQSEAVAMYRVFGKRLSNLPISSIKSSIGHCMGAASALEAVICALAVYYQTAPPTINTKDVDPTFPTSLDVVQGKARSFPIRHAISNAFAFGGNVASVVFSHSAARA